MDNDKADNILELVGNTPMVKLNHLADPDAADEPASGLWPAGGFALILAPRSSRRPGCCGCSLTAPVALLIDGAFLAVVLAVLAAVIVDIWTSPRR